MLYGLLHNFLSFDGITQLQHGTYPQLFQQSKLLFCILYRVQYSLCVQLYYRKPDVQCSLWSIERRWHQKAIPNLIRNQTGEGNSFYYWRISHSINQKGSLENQLWIETNLQITKLICSDFNSSYPCLSLNVKFLSLSAVYINNTSQYAKRSMGTISADQQESGTCLPYNQSFAGSINETT